MQGENGRDEGKHMWFRISSTNLTNSYLTKDKDIVTLDHITFRKSKYKNPHPHF